MIIIHHFEQKYMFFMHIDIVLKMILNKCALLQKTFERKIKKIIENRWKNLNFKKSFKGQEQF